MTSGKVVTDEQIAGVLARLVGAFGLAAIVRAAFNVPERE